MAVAAETPLLGRIRDRVVNTPDTVCTERARLVTDAYRQFDGMPVPLKRARAFAYILEHMALDTDTNPYFAGNMSTGPNAWMLLPEYSLEFPNLVRFELPGGQRLADSAYPDDIRAYWSSRNAGMTGGSVGHLCVDHAVVLARGLNAVAADAEALAGSGSPAQRTYRQAMAMGCRAVVAWAGRYADTLELRAPDAAPEERELLLRAAAACRRVPGAPARNLFEALQAVVLVHLAVHIEGHGYSVSTGCLDRLLLPYYDDDEDAETLLAAFMLKLTENSLWGSHSKTQAITLGGMDTDGRDRCNPLTRHILNAWERVRIPDPMLFLRWHRNLDAAVQEKAAAMLTRGLSMPLLVGDEQTMAGLLNAGIDADDAAAYCVVGCNELGIPGKLLWDSVRFNSLELLRTTLLDPETARSCLNMETLLEQLAEHAETALEEAVRGGLRRRQNQADAVPTPFTSALMHDAVEQGVDLCRWMRYDRLSVVERGFSNLVDGLAAVEDLVFKRGTYTMNDFAQALQNDFEGYDGLRAAIGRSPKWGTDDDRADRLAVRWCGIRDGVRKRVEERTGYPNLMFEHVVRSHHHLDGMRMEATPDGRRKGEPVADSIGACIGVQCGGPTALLNSVLKLNPAAHWTGGYNLNMALPLSDWNDPAMAERFIALVDAFFANGGQELQVNCLDADRLRDAQAHPEKYPELIVRIAGFSALFVKMTRTEQEEIIARAGTV